jgi:hypothetical protein
MNKSEMLPIVIVLSLLLASATPLLAQKTASVFYPARLLENAQRNIDQYDWAKAMQQRAVDAADPWLMMSDDDLWNLIFGHRIERSWMVWSDGHCPNCNEPVKMYDWKVDAVREPWKMWCGHCAMRFPTNDFQAYHTSGLDEQGVFDPDLADRSLLFNTDHPDPDDPLHTFGVDDGTGYAQGDKLWRFVGTYLIYGQWKQAIVGGINSLANAYVVTGEPIYAHKCAILLDRLADVHPEFDFATQGWVYERRADAGFISTWHDAAEELRQVVFAYDMIFDGIKNDEQLVAFLAEKAKRYKLDNPKTSLDLIHQNIAERILRDVIANRKKIESNYPTTDITVLMIRTILDWLSDRADILETLDGILRKATAVDGLSGEKGLAGYSVIAPNRIAYLLARYDRVDAELLGAIYKRFPALRDMYRFHIDTWIDMRYYPQIGDTGNVGGQYLRYAAIGFDNHKFTPAPGINPSAYTFLWRLAQIADEPDFLRVMYHANGKSTENLPHDLFIGDPDQVQRDVQATIDQRGEWFAPPSINKQQWHVALLRAGQPPQSRTAWIAYDVRGGHGHFNGMNLGLVAKGFEILPEFGYPPVQFGGWTSPRATWYMMTAAHNTVVVDGKNQIANAAAQTTLWAIGDGVQAMRFDGPDMIGGSQYERTVALADTSDDDSYVLDIFRVAGGKDHAQFFHGTFGELTVQGVSLSPTEDYGHDTQMRNFQGDATPAPGWTADWKVEDVHQIYDEPRDIHLRYTGLTADAAAHRCETWVSTKGTSDPVGGYLNSIMIRRRATGDDPLASTFVGVLEPYEGKPLIASAVRRDEGDAIVVEIKLADGRRDVWSCAADGTLEVARFDAQGRVARVNLSDIAARPK